MKIRILLGFIVVVGQVWAEQPAELSFALLAAEKQLEKTPENVQAIAAQLKTHPLLKELTGQSRQEQLLYFLRTAIVPNHIKKPSCPPCSSQPSYMMLAIPTDKAEYIALTKRAEMFRFMTMLVVSTLEKEWETIKTMQSGKQVSGYVRGLLKSAYSDYVQTPEWSKAIRDSAPYTLSVVQECLIAQVFDLDKLRPLVTFRTPRVSKICVQPSRDFVVPTT